MVAQTLGACEVQGGAGKLGVSRSVDKDGLMIGRASGLLRALSAEQEQVVSAIKALCEVLC